MRVGCFQARKTFFQIRLTAPQVWVLLDVYTSSLSPYYSVTAHLQRAGSEAVVPDDFVSAYSETYPGSDVTAEEFVFLKAMERFQRTHKRRYPTWREVLFVLKSLGYRKVRRATAIELECLFPVEQAEQLPEPSL